MKTKELKQKINEVLHHILDVEKENQIVKIERLYHRYSVVSIHIKIEEITFKNIDKVKDRLHELLQNIEIAIMPKDKYYIEIIIDGIATNLTN